MKLEDHTQRPFGRIDPPFGPGGQPRLEVVDIPGVGVSAGVAYGESRTDLVHDHLESVIRRAELRKGLSQGDLFDRARLFEPHVRAEAPDIADEIEGIATGAGIPSEAAWLLQLRAEATRIDPNNLPAECTSFGAAAQATKTGRRFRAAPGF